MSTGELHELVYASHTLWVVEPGTIGTPELRDVGTQDVVCLRSEACAPRLVELNCDEVGLSTGAKPN
jgi:hypothetical protein